MHTQVKQLDSKRPAAVAKWNNRVDTEVHVTVRSAVIVTDGESIKRRKQASKVLRRRWPARAFVGSATIGRQNWRDMERLWVRQDEVLVRGVALHIVLVLVIVTTLFVLVIVVLFFLVLLVCVEICLSAQGCHLGKDGVVCGNRGRGGVEEQLGSCRGFHGCCRLLVFGHIKGLGIGARC
jgi:hypothetical protein